MALLEKLQPGNVYLVKVSASNDMGDGPFSHAVELAVQLEGSARGHGPHHLHGSSHTTGQYPAPRSSLQHTGVGMDTLRKVDPCTGGRIDMYHEY